MKDFLLKLKEKDKQTIIRAISVMLTVVVLVTSGIFLLKNRSDKAATSVLLIEESGEYAVASETPTEKDNEETSTESKQETSINLETVTEESINPSSPFEETTLFTKEAVNNNDDDNALSESSQTSKQTDTNTSTEPEQVIAAITETEAEEKATEPQTVADIVEDVTLPDNSLKTGTSANSAVEYYVSYYEEHGFTVINASESSNARTSFISQVNNVINNNSYSTYNSDVDGYVTKIVVIAPQGSGIAQEFENIYKIYANAYSNYNLSNAGERHLTVMNLSTDLLGQSLQTLEERRISICWYGYQATGCEIATAQVTALCSGSQYTQALAKAKSIASAYNSGTTYDKIYNVYQYFSSNMSYDYDEVDYNNHTEAHSPYGSLVENLAVCDGFASGFSLVMDQLGIPCNIVVNSNHAWNEVFIDGEWYFIDVTMGVSGSSQYLAGFLFGQDLMCATSDKVVSGDYTFTWSTSYTNYYGYGSSGVNSSTITLGSTSYIIKKGLISIN